MKEVNKTENKLKRKREHKKMKTMKKWIVNEKKIKCKRERKIWKKW